MDNAIESGATRIDVILQRPERLKEHQRQESVSAVAFIDNGSGMLPQMARFALSWERRRLQEGQEKKGKKLENDAQRRFEIRKSRCGISFVRANREIETLDAFPRSARRGERPRPLALRQ